MGSKEYEICSKEVSDYSWSPMFLAKFKNCKDVSLEEAVSELKQCFSPRESKLTVDLTAIETGKGSIVLKFHYSPADREDVALEKSGYEKFVRIRSIGGSLDRLTAVIYRSAADEIEGIATKYGDLEPGSMHEDLSKHIPKKFVFAMSKMGYRSQTGNTVQVEEQQELTKEYFLRGHSKRGSDTLDYPDYDTPPKMKKALPQLCIDDRTTFREYVAKVRDSLRNKESLSASEREFMEEVEKQEKRRKPQKRQKPTELGDDYDLY